MNGWGEEARAEVNRAERDELKEQLIANRDVQKFSFNLK